MRMLDNRKMLENQKSHIIRVEISHNVIKGRDATRHCGNIPSKISGVMQYTNTKYFSHWAAYYE
jgi:hypothetical protein